MEFVVRGVDETLAAVEQDASLDELRDLLATHPELRLFVVQVVRECIDSKALRNRHDGIDTIFKDSVVRGQPRYLRRHGDRVRQLLIHLYAAHKGSNARGAIWEAIVADELAPAYAAPAALHRNVQFELRNGTSFDSGNHSVDIAGVGSGQGELHECKVRVTDYKQPWVDELQTHAPRFGLIVSLTTTDDRDRAIRELARRGIALNGGVLTTTQDVLGEMLPLAGA